MPPTSTPPYQAPPASGNPTRYDFFLNPPPPPKKPWRALSFGQKRVWLIVGAVIGLIIVVVIAKSLSGGKNPIPQLLAVAQQQTELARVAGEASGLATQQVTLNLAESVQLSLTSNQQQWVKYLQLNGHKVNQAVLNATQNSQTDQTLSAAQAASNYDSVFDQVMTNELQTYVQDMRNAYPVVGPKGKAILRTDYNGAQLLLTQAQNAANSLGST